MVTAAQGCEVKCNPVLALTAVLCRQEDVGVIAKIPLGPLGVVGGENEHRSLCPISLFEDSHSCLKIIETLL